MTFASELPIRVTVVGLGKLGAPIAACLASRGFEVIGVDVDSKKIEAMNDGRAPVFEPGLAHLIASAGVRLLASHDLEAAVGRSDATFILVPTPSDPDGGFSVHHVLQACREIGRGIRGRDYHLVVVTSTLLPGATGGPVKHVLEDESGKRCGSGFGLCYSPEFVALGSVISDFLHPDFLLIGESDRGAGDRLEAIYRRVHDGRLPPVARMSLESAEVAKLAVNTFVTAKISFANMVARICEMTPGADAQAVTAALGLDSRIGSKYLKGAISYGGPCFPRDNRALAAVARTANVPAMLPEAVDSFNTWQLSWLAERLSGLTARGETIGILGLSYKPNTDVAEASPGLWVGMALAGRGIPVVAYDPAAASSAAAMSGDAIALVDCAEECVRRGDVVAIVTPWAEFRSMPPQVWARRSRPRTVVDCWGILPELTGIEGVRYLPLGRSWEDAPAARFVDTGVGC
ncbi:MAG: UDP-glucose dehydrogenase family protein [Candidatus Methylomirabilis sp.]